MVGLIEPAGASDDALDEAILAGAAPIVRVKLAVVVPEVIETAVSPVRVAAVHDQLPVESAVAETDCVPTVPVTAAPAVVTPEKVGVADVTQKCFAPWIKVAPPTVETRPEPASTSPTAKSEKTIMAAMAARRLAKRTAII